jgi:SMC interacting uncharacterized protein involved in chromosome segregation
MLERKAYLFPSFVLVTGDCVARFFLGTGELELTTKEAMELIAALSSFVGREFSNVHVAGRVELINLESKRKQVEEDEELDREIERVKKRVEKFGNLAETFQTIANETEKALEEYDSI